MSTAGFSQTRVPYDKRLSQMLELMEQQDGILSLSDIIRLANKCGYSDDLYLALCRNLVAWKFITKQYEETYSIDEDNRRAIRKFLPAYNPPAIRRQLSAEERLATFSDMAPGSDANRLALRISRLLGELNNGFASLGAIKRRNQSDLQDLTIDLSIDSDRAQQIMELEDHYTTRTIELGIASGGPDTSSGALAAAIRNAEEERKKLAVVMERLKYERETLRLLAQDQALINHMEKLNDLFRSLLEQAKLL